MVNGVGKPDIAYGKVIAALAGGVISIILVYVYERATRQPFPAELWAIIQTFITTAAVYYVPHTIGKP